MGGLSAVGIIIPRIRGHNTTYPNSSNRRRRPRRQTKPDRTIHNAPERRKSGRFQNENLSSPPGDWDVRRLNSVSRRVINAMTISDPTVVYRGLDFPTV